MRIPAERLTTADQAYSPQAEVRTKGGGRARPVLIVLLALLYPWHFAVWATSYTGKNPTIPHGGLNLSLGDSMIALIGVVLLLQLAGGRVRLPRYALQTFVWFTVAAVSVTVSALSPAFFFELHDSEVGLVKILAAATWMIAVFWLLEDSFPQRFLLLGGSSVLAATGFAVASVIENVFLGIERPFGPFQNANIYGNYLMLNVFLAIGIDRLLGQPAGRVAVRPAVRRALRLAIRFGAVTILILGLLATGSRGAMVGFGIGLLLAVPWGAVKRLSLRGTVAFAVGALVLALALSWYLGRNPYVVTRWSQTAAGQGPNVEERFALWEGALQAFSEHPVLGIGYAQFPNYAGHQPYLRATVTHQTYLATAAELGAPGLLALLWLLLSVILDSWRVKDRAFVGVAHACCGFVVAASTQGLFNNVQQERSLWIVFGMVAALIAYLRTSRVGPPSALVARGLR